MATLTHQRCFHHALREAAARCPECRNFYCRECITEHEDRVICAACLKKLAKVPFTQRGFVQRLLHLGQFVVGFALVVIFFYLIGQGLLSIPSDFHDGTIWKPNWAESQVEP